VNGGHPEAVETRAPDWGFIILGLIALFTAEAVASGIGLSPERSIGALEAKQLEAALDAVFAPDISARLLTWAGFAFAGISSLLVVWAGVMVPRDKSLVVSIATGLVVMASLLLAWITSGHWVLAGLTTGLIMFLSALAARQTGTVKAIGVALGTLYFLFAVLGITSGLSGSDEALEIVRLSGVGILVGVAILVGLHFLNVATRYKLIPDRKPIAKAPATGAAEIPSFFARGPGMRYAIARGTLLGIGMALYKATLDTGVFWAMIAVWVVLQPVGSATWEKALRRGLGILAGCLAVGVLSQLVSGETLIWIGFGLLIVGLAYYRRSYPIYQACMSMLVITFYADLSGEGILHWALLRIGDNAIGIALALVTAYVVFPDRRGKDGGDPSPTVTSG
jgi:hypothetical protein